MKKNLFYLLVILFAAITTFADAQIMANQKPLMNNFTGNWLNKTSGIDAGDTVVFDMSLAVCSGAYLIIPVSIISDDLVWAIDFSMKYDESKITFDTIIDCTSYLSAAASYNVNDSTLRFTSFSFMQPIEHDTPVVAIRFNLLSPPVAGSDLNSIVAYLNGDTCSYKLIDVIFPTTAITPDGPIIFMNGDSVSLSANADTSCTYLWSTGETTQTITAYNTGTYTVTVTTAGGCDAAASVNVYVMAPLPVQLIDFNVKEVDSEILIDWTTANENNNDSFTVEHSANATDWKELEKVNGAVNPNTINHYSIKDEFPLNGFNYYRLKQTDYNGTEKYLQVKSIYYSKQKSNDLQLVLYPNPANEILNIKASENATIQLIASDGSSIVLQQNIYANQKVALNSSALANGVYTLKISNSNFLAVKKVVIRK